MYTLQRRATQDFMQLESREEGRAPQQQRLPAINSHANQGEAGLVIILIFQNSCHPEEIFRVSSLLLIITAAVLATARGLVAVSQYSPAGLSAAQEKMTKLPWWVRLCHFRIKSKCQRTAIHYSVTTTSSLSL